MRDSGDIAMPPLTPGIWIVWTIRPTRRLRFERQRLPRSPDLHLSAGWSSTMRMSFL